jgi:thiamine biosynthesis protein ThiI
VTDAATEMPVLRPLIGMDKEEIVEVSRKIGTFDTSILPYEDCCTVFTPRHPKTKPTENEILSQVAKIDFDGLLDEAYATLYTETRRVEGYDS